MAMKIAILGGGVAGVSSAIALAQKGFEVDVYERNASPATIGAGIVLWPNACYVLEQLRVLDQVALVSGRPGKMRRMNASGESLGAIDIELINRIMGYPSFSIMRVDFQNILLEKLKAMGVSIHFDHTITRIDSDCDGSALVHFDQRSSIRADVIIGADGRMASQARHYILGLNAPNYQGFINWIGVFESEQEIFETLDVSDYWGVGERFGIVPVSKSKAYWAGGIASREIGSRNSTEYKKELVQIFHQWPSLVRQIIDGTQLRRINKIYVHDHNPVHVWHKNNLIMIGDAAHAPLPTSGQGACQALEDAWQIANCLDQNRHDLQTAFSRFTDIRFNKTTNIIMAARGFAASLFNRDQDYCEKRNDSSKRSNFVEVAKAMSHAWAQNLPLGNG